MNQIREAQSTALNQMKFLHEETKDNIMQFQKKVTRQNPFNSMQYTWQVAQMRKAFVFFCTLPFVIGEEYWKVWHEVYRYPTTAPKGEQV